MTSIAETTRRTRDDLAELAEHLIGEYEGALPAGTVIRCMAREVHEQRMLGVPQASLALEVEPLVRLDLEDLVHVRRAPAS